MDDVLSFDDRMSIATSHESNVVNVLRSIGLEVGRFDCFNANPSLSQALRRTESLVRWTPDLLVVDERQVLGLGQVLVVECKGSTEKNRTSRRYCIERRTVDNLSCHYYVDGVSPVVIWHDMRITHYVELIGALQDDPPPPGASGSGTPYYLVDRDRLPDRFLPWPTLTVFDDL